MMNFSTYRRAVLLAQLQPVFIGVLKREVLKGSAQLHYINITYVIALSMSSCFALKDSPTMPV